MKSLPARCEVPRGLQTLVEQYCAGELAADDWPLLERHLRGDLQARLFFVAYLNLHAGLQWGLRGPADGAGGSPLPASCEKHLAVQAASQSHRKTVRWSAALGYSMLAVVLVAFAGFFYRAARSVQDLPESVQSEMTVARLGNLRSEVIVERAGVSHSAHAGMELFFNDRLKVSDGGSALVKMPNASQMELGPRTVLTFEHEGRPELREGFVQIDATQRRGNAAWSIRTPEADAEVRGSRFAVGAGPLQTMVRVAEGSVSVSRRRDGAIYDVSQGQCSAIAQHVDSLPVPSLYGTVLMIVSREERIPPHIERAPSWDKFNTLVGERLISDRLWRLALSVEMRTFDDVVASDLENRPFVIVSLFDFDQGIEARLERIGLAQAKVPVLCLEPAAFPVLGMTGPVLQEDFGFRDDSLLIDIAEPAHPLAAEFAGEGVAVFSREADRSLGWARPPASAIRVAHLHGFPHEWMLFGFEKGAAMHDRIAPARRVGLFLNPHAVDERSPALRLIDAAIQWCVECSEPRIARQPASNTISAMQLPFYRRQALR